MNSNDKRDDPVAKSDLFENRLKWKDDPEVVSD